MSNSNYSSFLNSVIQQLSDSNPEIVTLAREALIEIGVNSPIKMSEALIKALTSYSSNSNINRAEIIKVLHSISLKNFSTNLISTITYTILNLLTFSPPLTGEICAECIELLNTFCKMNATVTSCEIRSISNNTFSIMEFFLTRIRNKEMVFFISDNHPATPFTLLVNNLPKTSDEKVRSQFCQLLTELSDVLIDSKTDLKILTPTLFSCMDVIMNTWSKGIQSPNKSDYYRAISSVVNAVDILQLSSRFDKLVNFFNEALQNSSTKKAAAAGLPSVLSLIERIRDKPKIQSTQSAKLLFDFIDSEYANIQTDGSIMRSINNAVGGMTALLNVYPKSPLDVVLNKIPQPASFYVLNYYCNLFGDRYAKEIGSSLSKVNLSSMSNETKALYANCFFTLIKKCGISYEKQEKRKEEEKAEAEMRAKDAQTYNEYYVAPAVYVTQNDSSKNSTIKFEVPKNVPSFDEILMKISMFIGADQNDPSTRDAKIQFGFIMKHNVEAFRYVYPKIFSYLMMPSLFFSSPTLISVCDCATSFIEKEVKMIKEAKIDEFQLIATLLMLALSDLFIPTTKAEFRRVISSISGISSNSNNTDNLNENKNENDEVVDSDVENDRIEKLVHSILSKHETKEYHSSLLKVAQNNVTSYINYGGDQPIHSATNRSALLSSNAKLLGFFLQSKYNNSELDSVLTALIVQMSPLDSLRIAAIAKFIGITSAFNPEKAVSFVKANMDMIIANQENKLKFWKKKEKPTLEPVSCTLSIGEILKYSPLSFNDFGVLIGNFNSRFIESKDVPNWAKMRTIEAIINRNTNDPKFSVPNAKIYSTRASIVAQESTDFGTFISSVDALYSICMNNASNIERPEIVLGNTLKFVDKNFKPNENVECISHVSKFIQKIVSSKQMDSPSIICNFHDVTSSFLSTPNWSKFVDSMNIVVNSFQSVKDPNPIKFLQIIATYFIVSNARNSGVAKNVVQKLLTLLNPSLDVNISSPSEMAQVLIDNSKCEVNVALSNLFPSIATLSHTQLGSAANSLIRAFATTKQATSDPQTFAKEYIKHSNESGDSIVTLFKLDKEKIVDLLLSEQFSQNIATTASSLLSNNETRHDAIVTLIERAKLLNKKNEEEMLKGENQNQTFINPIESALSILSSVKYSIPYYSDNNGEYILVELSIINLKLRYSCIHLNDKENKNLGLSEKQIALCNQSNTNITTMICDIFSAMMSDNSIFNGDKNEARRSMLVPQEAPQIIRVVFRDFVAKKKGKSQSLFETIKKLNDLNDFVSQIVISIALGQILANKSTTPELSLNIVDFLTQIKNNESESMTNSDVDKEINDAAVADTSASGGGGGEDYLNESDQINTFNRIIALSEIFPYSEAAKVCSDKIIEFVLKNFKYAPGPGLNAILVILPSLSDEATVKSFDSVIKVVEQALSSKVVSSLGNTNSTALKILMSICSSTSLSKDGKAIEKLWQDYPLFLSTLYFCPDFSTSSKCLDLFNNRLGLARMTLPVGSQVVEDCFNEFVEVNSLELTKAISVNSKRFVLNLIDKSANHKCPDVRCLFAIFAMFLVGLQSSVIGDEEKEKIKEKIGELLNDQSEKVRIILAKSLESQLQ